MPNQPDCGGPNPPPPCNDDGEFCPADKCEDPPPEAPIPPIGGVLLGLAGAGYGARRLLGEGADT